MKAIIAAPPGYFQIAIPEGMDELPGEPDGGFLADPIVAFIINTDDAKPTYSHHFGDVMVCPVTVTGIGAHRNDEGCAYVIRAPDGTYRYADSTYSTFSEVMADFKQGRFRNAA